MFGKNSKMICANGKAYSLNEDLPVLREHLIRKIRIERDAGARNCCGEILSYSYDGEIDKIADDL